MGFSIKEWLLSFGKKSPISTPVIITDMEQEINIAESAYNACINLIANIVSNCELKVYKNYKKEHTDEWYRWNVQPNPVQNSSDFLKKLVYKLYRENEALIVIRPGGELYVADAFTRNIPTTVFFEPTYSNIVIDNLPYSPTLYESQVMYFKLHNKNVMNLNNQILSLYGELISTFISSYKDAKGLKAILHVDQIAENGPNFQEAFKNIGNQLKSMLSKSSAIVTLFDGYSFDVVSNNQAPSFDTRDMRAQIQDIFEITAMTFGIPKHLITGDVQDNSKAIDSLLTFCIDPLLNLIEKELDRKLFNKKESQSGSYVKFRTNTIKHIDILDVAGNVEKLISSGAMTINEIRDACGFDSLDSAFADDHFMTKNFAPVDDLVDSLERRDGDEG